MLNPETPKILNYLMEKQHYGFENLTIDDEFNGKSLF